MPVTLKAKIKIRRGIENELPNLSDYELGYSTDTGSLFIGASDLPSLANKGRGGSNEQFPYSNVRIITDSYDQSPFQKYIYSSNGPTLPQTGPSLTQPVVRTYSQRFNDTVFLDNFIFEKTEEDDISDDLNRALRQVYTGVSEKERKVLHINAGKYFIKNTILVPPYTHIKGEGRDKTILEQMSGGDVLTMFKTVDSLFQQDFSIGFGAATLPKSIEISDLTIKVTNIITIFSLFRANNVTFRRVKFEGPVIAANGAVALHFDRLGSIIDMFGFKCIECVFENLGKVTNDLDEETNIITNVKFDKCSVNGVYSGMRVDHEDISHVTWINSLFANISTQLFDLLHGSHFSSMNNYFDMPTLANNYHPIKVEPEFISFSSTSDKAALSNDRPIVLNKSKSSYIFSGNSESFTFAGTEFFKNFETTIGQNQSSTVLGPTFALARYNNVFMDYCVKRDDSVRMGKLRISHVDGEIYLFDSFDQTGDTGITFSATVDTILGEPHMVIRYSTPNNGGVGEIQADHKAFMA